ncbi:MAG TPA: hypothetical protein EYO74_01475 [Piscirickettsiaceae bacterium]|jgi:hypothetical protein|nr:hypothetical protein [Piscirickettsiaceae bacterium]
MKKIFAVVLLAFALSANAFWNNNNSPWGGNNSYYGGGYNDNGMFGYNPYDFWDPRWYFEEMDNMMDEFDNNSWGNNYGGSGYNPYNNSRYSPWNSAAPIAPRVK